MPYLLVVIPERVARRLLGLALLIFEALHFALVTLLRLPHPTPIHPISHPHLI